MEINKVIGGVVDVSTQLVKDIRTYLIGATVASAIVAGSFSYNHEIERTKRIPLGFSEKTQIELDAAAQGRKVESVTDYLTSLNDTCMKVFEAWNDSWKPMAEFQTGNNYERFAYNLSNKLNSEKHHYKLGDLLQSLPNEADNVVKELSGFDKIRPELSSTASHFGASWQDFHHDNYHNENYWSTETYIDSDGDLHTRLVEKERRVYDNTDHHYEYNHSEGELAALSLDKVINYNPDLSANIELFTASKTNPEGRRVALESRIKGNKKPEDFSEKQYSEIADTWKYGSVFFENRGSFANPFSSLKNDSVEWAKAKQTAGPRDYRTTSSTHEGPWEFRVARKSLHDAESLTSSLDAVFNSIAYTKANIPMISKDIDSLIELSRSDVEEKDLEKASNDLINKTTKLYQATFKRGFEIERFRGGMVALWGLLGLLGGGTFSIGAFAGYEYLKNRKA